MASNKVGSWAENARIDKEYQRPECQRIIDIFQTLFATNTTPEEAAHDIVATLEPLIKQSPGSLRTTSVWGILCTATRALGSKQHMSESLVKFLEAMCQIEVKDEHGYVIRHAWGGNFWTDLPTFAMMFREYDIDSDEEMEINDWLAQAPALLNATSFAATALARSSGLEGMAFYVPGSMQDALNEECDSPEPQYRLAMYVPAASAWIQIAGPKIHALCREGTRAGFSLERWQSWKGSFGDIAEDDDVQGSVREEAKKAVEAMTALDENE